ncbi:hypothetical protein [Proteiniphilum acetatigenes]|uniref:hypothetical protein n=1 Tax=Proteiniphilum acetatigenes TaxID=294710 RepID=UPI0003607B53|nr:hypothetical protein [Proteiniphilum acetatigenes]
MKKCKYLFYLILWATPFISVAQESEVQQKENNQSGSNNLELFRGCKECRISKGSCADIIKSLQVYQDNDSLAIDIFKKEYEITNMPLSQKTGLLKRNHVDIIQYFNSDKTKKYHCELKRIKSDDPVLIDMR